MNFETVFESHFDSSHRIEDLPKGLPAQHYTFVRTEIDNTFHSHLYIMRNTWRDGGEIVREGENSFMQAGIPEVSVESSNDCPLDEWPRGADAYNFLITNWFSAMISGTTTSSFIATGESDWHSVSLEADFTSSWSDGYPRLPRVPHKRLNDNGCVTFCILPKSELDAQVGASGAKHSIPYRYDYFHVLEGEVIRTRICNSDYSGNLILALGSIEGQEGSVIPYYTKQNQHFTALEETIAISCVRY